MLFIVCHFQFEQSCLGLAGCKIFAVGRLDLTLVQPVPLKFLFGFVNQDFCFFIAGLQLLADHVQPCRFSNAKTLSTLGLPRF